MAAGEDIFDGLWLPSIVSECCERFAVEQALAIEKTKSRPIVPTTTADGVTLVDW